METICAERESMVNVAAPKAEFVSLDEPRTKSPGQKGILGKYVTGATVYEESAACASVNVHTPREHAESLDTFFAMAKLPAPYGACSCPSAGGVTRRRSNRSTPGM